MKKTKESFRLLFILFALIVLWPISHVSGIEVRKKNSDKTIAASRVEFDGESGNFTIYYPSALIMSASEIDYINADEAGVMSELREKNTALDAQVNKFTADAKELNKRIAGQQNIIEDNKIKITNLKATVDQNLEDSAVSNMAELKNKVRDLESEVKKLTAENRRLGDRIRMKSETIPVQRTEFPITHKKHEPAKVQGLWDVSGRIQNPGPDFIDTLILQVSALGKKGEPLGTTLTFISNFKAGQTRTFEADIKPKGGPIDDVQVVVVDFF